MPTANLGELVKITRGVLEILVDLAGDRLVVDQLEGARLPVLIEIGHLEQHDLPRRTRGVLLIDGEENP